VEYSSASPSTPQPARPERAAIAPSELSPAQDGRDIFLANCASCHGRNADGDTPAGRAWHVPDLHSAEVQGLPDQQLLQIIRQGKGKMPAWNALLSPPEMADILAYMRTLKKP
jgi:mono/diheme cytochrome c family protein